ncbi:MAG TPA: META domain-containing protein [Thermoanaerobaculia bacterium]
MKKVLPLLLTTVALLMLFNCAAAGTTPTFEDRDWTYVSRDAQPTIRFSSATHEVTGSTGCNQLSGTYTITGTSLTFGPLATTKRACEGPVMQVERELLQGLQHARRWAVRDGELELTDDAGGVVARFR